MAALLPESILLSSLGSSLVDSFCGRKQQHAPSSPAFSVQAMGRRILDAQQKQLMLAAPAEGKQPIKLYSSDYYWMCALGGILACGPTHTAVAPLDVVKCNMQIDHNKFKNVSTGFRVTMAEGGLAGLTRGWAPTLVGYSIQGAGKYGLYELFKKKYSDLVGEEAAKNNKTLVFLAASASAEFFADIGLCPLEAVKVKVQTTPGWAKGLSDGLPKFVAEQGVAGLWRGIVPLWGRQIPYTMAKFTVFESTVVALYENVVPKPKSECTKVEQIEVSFLAGYIAGVFCAVISQPADNMVSALNNSKSASMSSVIADMGWTALFTRGLGLRVAMIGTLTGAQWAIYDAFKVWAGFPATGGH